MSETGTDNATPRVIAVNLSVTKGVPKQPVASGEFIADHGLKGDAHAGKWHRQVSLLGRESIERMAAQGVGGLSPGRFAENITTENIILYRLNIGDRLTIGQVLLEITQIGKECHQHCAIFRQVGNCVMPTEGVFARVLNGGTIKAGDPIRVERNEI